MKPPAVCATTQVNIDGSWRGRCPPMTHRVGSSAGSAPIPVPAGLMKSADIALYRAKAQGRNRALTYSPAMRREIEKRVSLGAELREGLARNQIVPFYQPKICLKTGRIVGFEALARWE